MTSTYFISYDALFHIAIFTEMPAPGIGPRSSRSSFIGIQCFGSLILAGLGILASTVASIGGYYTSLGDFPDITGSMKIPPATAGWGTIALALTALTQAAIKNPNKKILGFTILLIGIATAGIGLTAAVSASEEHAVDEHITSNFITRMKDYKNGSALTNQIDQIQESLSCCGAMDFRSYETLPAYRHGAVPTSCCATPKPGCGEPPLGHDIHKKGCIKDLTTIVTTAYKHCSISLTLLGSIMAFMWTILMLYLTCVL